MGNLDFTNHAGFSWYCLLLMFSGIVTLVLSVVLYSGPVRRIISALVGLGFFGYGFYLAFIFSSGHYVIFYRAFIVPVLLIIYGIRSRAGQRRQASRPVAASASGVAFPGPQPMADPGLPPVADQGLQPMADPGVPPMADPGLPPASPS